MLPRSLFCHDPWARLWHSGLAEECNGFLLQCSMALEMQPHWFPTERAKISFIISLLTWRVLQRADTIWWQNDPVTQTLNSFVTLPQSFCKPAGATFIGGQLYHLKQGKMSINNYALKFRTLAAESGWISLHTLIPSASRKQQLTQRLCLYCSAAGHVIVECPNWPPWPLVSVVQAIYVSSSRLTTKVFLTVSNISFSVTALINSGSAGNFIFCDLWCQFHLQKTQCERHYKAQSIIGNPLNCADIRYRVDPLHLHVGMLHQEEIH